MTIEYNWSRAESWEALYLERLDDAKVGRIVLNRPEKRNAMSLELMNNFHEALEIIRTDDSITVVITKGAGQVYCAGQDLPGLKKKWEGPLEDWDRPQASTRLYNAVRVFPKVMIAQVHGYCLGGAVALLNSHDLAVAADDAQIGMPEIIRGSFGMNVAATLFHSNIPFKKAAMLQLSGRNITGSEADALGIVSMSVPEAELEAVTTELAREISTRHPQALAHAKAAVDMGRDLPLQHAMQVDLLLTTRLRNAINPLDSVDDYLASQRGGTNTEYVRADVDGSKPTTD